MRRLSMSAKALSNSSPRFGASSTNSNKPTRLNNNKQLDSTTTNQLCLTILNYSVTPFPSPLIRDLCKHQKPLFLRTYYKILWLAKYICVPDAWCHMMSSVTWSHQGAVLHCIGCTQHTYVPTVIGSTLLTEMKGIRSHWTSSQYLPAVWRWEDNTR